MKTPLVTVGVGFINYLWLEYKLRVVAEHYTSDGQAELEFYHQNETGEMLLHITKVNLLATPTMSSLVKRLEENFADIPWTDILTYVTSKTLKTARQGEPVEEIWPSEDDALTPSYLLDPLLPEKHPAVIFGDYGSLKSLFALVIAYIVQLPYYDNNLGLTTREETTHCLYLDYEDDRSSFRRRWSAILKGFGIEATMPILYQRMTTTLPDAIEQLQRIIAERNIGLLIIDSLGPAARGNLNDAEPAIKYHEALRKLGVTSLTLAHTAKDQLTRKRTIFGSVFFTNLARSVWECKAEQETGEDEAVISLKHSKANLSKPHLPLGFRFSFGGDTITVTKADLRDTGLSGELPLSWQIKNLLRQGPLTARELTQQLDSRADTIGRTLRRMRSNEQVIKLEDDTWGLAF